MPLRPGDWTRTHLGYALAKLDRREQVEALLREIRDDYHIARMHLALGRRGQALAALERALAEPSANMPWVKVDAWMAESRGDPRFEAVLARMGLGNGTHGFPAARQVHRPDSEKSFS